MGEDQMIYQRKRSAFVFTLTILISGAAVMTFGCSNPKEKSKTATVGDPIDEQGRTTVAIDASLTTSQSVTAGTNSGLEGTSIEFPPGSLAINTEITLEAGQSIATTSVAKALGMESEVVTAGPATVVTASMTQDAVVPFTVAIVTNNEGLALTGDLIVIYKIYKASEGKLYLGVIPGSEVTRTGQLVTFAASHFGVYEAVLASHIGNGSEVETEIPIVTKANMPTVSFKSATASYSEGGVSAEVVLVLSDPVEGVVSVTYGLGGTATEDDHTLIAGSFVLASGETEQTLSFNIIDDDIKENDTLDLTLVGVTNARLGDAVKMSITIEDND